MRLFYKFEFIVLEDGLGVSALRKWLICALLLAVVSLQALAQQSPFILTYQTTAPNEIIVFPAFGPGYDFTID